MKVPVGINKFRRLAMHSLTKYIGKTSKIQTLNSVQIESIKKVLVVRPNHRLGNMLLTMPLLQEISLRFPNARTDILAKGGLAPIVLKNYEGLNEFILLPRRPFDELFKYGMVWLRMKFSRYDLIINAVKGSSSGKLLTLITNSNYKVFQNIEDQLKPLDSTHNATEAIYALRSVFSLNNSDNTTLDTPLLDLKLTESELEKGKEIIDTLFDNKKSTIAIFTFATGSKCYSQQWWSLFYEQLKVDFPHCNILEILPMENVSQINFEATSFYSKDIMEIGSVMANCNVFIGADSGIMHLASASGVPTIGLFTGRIDNYKPYGNLNCGTNTTNTCLKDWMAIIAKILKTDSSGIVNS
ncbi:glycosyltransferase family 9 protein [Nonlabens antarcticus]|uniref:glycosyltransferase family 9 protein n=1 Tax=Nonlabens antarcticus TaxID=392714 RepID=UPI0018919B3B|nr:glycosyltransferase family 9 protein [Nonlabens antarcticus]